MKYVILIHSNPRPWGHPTQMYTEEGRALSTERTQQMDREFEALMEEISASGELVTAEALGDPASSTLYGWSPEGHLATDGPYAEAKEHLAGFFLIDCETRTRAEEIAAHFAQPGGTVELRPAMWPGGDDN
ncbi:MAG: YciI family protein [Mycobacteriales bacterium]